MIDAERMLGSLMRNAMSGSGRRQRRRRRRRRTSMLGTAGKGALAMGALGVAIAAFEHFAQQGKPGAAFDGDRSAVPPPPPPPSGSRITAPPPPPPPQADTAAPPAPNEEALLLVRAMIAAANADHEVDSNERQTILDALDASGLGDEERKFVLSELESPIQVRELVRRADRPELARQIYLASLMAIAVDTPAEEEYLSRLATHLGLDQEEVEKLEGMLGDDGETAPAV